MNNYIKHFRREYAILKKDGEKLITDYMVENIEGVLNAFAEEGHSGCSAGYAIPAITKMIEKTLKFEPLSPIEKLEDFQLQEAAEGFFQSRRLSSVFNEGKGAYYLNAIVWKDNDSSAFTGIIDGVSSCQYVKYPFTPKTFYIDVIEEEDGGHHIKNKRDLDKVFEYYNKMEE